jgi:hypothetical protein
MECIDQPGFDRIAQSPESGLEIGVASGLIKQSSTVKGEEREEKSDYRHFDLSPVNGELLPRRHGLTFCNAKSIGRPSIVGRNEEDDVADDVTQQTRGLT